MHGTLLDLASGPGRVAIALAPFFSRVIANDLDAGMVAVGKTKSNESKVNIEWIAGKAEELKIELNSIDLITISDAFHRVDQSLILDLAKSWLKPGAYIVLMGMYTVWQGNEFWSKHIREIINKWTSRLLVNKKLEFLDYLIMLKDKGFTNCSTYSFEFPHYFTVDSIIGYLYSTSICRKKNLGVDAEEFEAEIRSELLKINKNDAFFENVKCGYDIGRKPF
jgi:ubiquinone/menaquinone biosynthesis C-methylase UbiE